MLRKQGAAVHVIMTDNAQKFVTPLTFQTISKNPVLTSLWDEGTSWQPNHISLADQADLFVVAPATANVVASFAQGLAIDFLSTAYLATPAPVLIAPAMNGKMWEHPATKNNAKILRDRGNIIVDPDDGLLACGYEGVGKLAALEKIEREITSILA